MLELAPPLHPELLLLSERLCVRSCGTAVKTRHTIEHTTAVVDGGTHQASRYMGRRGQQQATAT